MPRRRRSDTDMQKRARILELHSQGKGGPSIARAVGISHQRVYAILADEGVQGSNPRRGGRPRS